MADKKKPISKLNPEDYIVADDNPAWLNTPSPFNELDDDWISIIVFFVFHVPAIGVSARSKKMEYYGWSNRKDSQDYKNLIEKLIKYSKMERKSFCYKDKNKDFKREIIKNNFYGNFPPDLIEEKVIFKKQKYGQVDSLLHHIRNSFAHGRIAFCKNNNITYIIMEDINKNNNVSARMILSKTTLLRWKTIILSGPNKSNEDLDNEFGETK